jgi:tripartite-type tricarboxylate transporter receptor subunit TctC
MNPVAKFLLIIAAMSLCAVHATAQNAAKDYPNKPVRWIVHNSPGAATDIVARLIAGKLTGLLDEPFIIDNREGGGGIIAATIVANSPPDGYTLLFTNPAPSISAPLMAKKPPYMVDDFIPIILFGYAPLIIVAHPSFPARNPKELIAALKANPGKYAWGTSGIGSSPHIGLALLQLATGGFDVVHVPYKGTAPALVDLLSGQIQLIYTSKVSAAGHIKAGRVRVLAAASPRRSQGLPDVPTLAEYGIKDADAVTWTGMAAPARTPRVIVDKLNAASKKVLAMPDVRKFLEDDDVIVQGGTPEEFSEFIKKEAGGIEKLLKTGALTKE